MSDTPKFEVIDRRKRKAEEEQETQTPAAPAAPEEAKGSGAGPRLVTSEDREPAAAAPTAGAGADGLEAEPDAEPDADLGPELGTDFEATLPPAPSAQESREQKTAYDVSAERIEDLIRAQNPGVGKQPPVSFEHLVQQFYVSAMIQMGAGTQEGQRPRVDILGARGTIDLLGVLAEKTRGNLTEAEDRMLQSILFECRMAFLELSSMINLQGVPNPAPPPAGKR
jgi:hypothetical protein